MLSVKQHCCSCMSLKLAYCWLIFSAFGPSLLRLIAANQVLELKKCLLLCGELLDYRHHHRCNSSTQATERCSVVRNRRVYLGVATLLSNMLQLLPRENVCIAMCVCGRIFVCVIVFFSFFRRHVCFCTCLCFCIFGIDCG